MKQVTAVEMLFEWLWETPKDKLTWYAMLEKAKEIENKKLDELIMLLKTTTEYEVLQSFRDKVDKFNQNNEHLPILIPIQYIDTPDHKSTIEYGKYLVVRKDGKMHLETFNGSGWAYNHNSIAYYYLPKLY